MSDHRPCRAIAKKHKSALNADSEQGGSGSKRPINLFHMLNTPHQQAPKPTNDEVPLKIHSPIEVRGILRKCANYMKQDQSTITKKREFTCYDEEKEASNDHFLSFFHADWYHSMFQSKKRPIANM
jgi:hypothetical protein